MRWIYLSPHFDDAIYSCGAAIWLQTHAGEQVEIWTICAGDPPAERPLSPFASQLHERWGLDDQVVEARRQEDATACQRLGASPRRLGIPDCIYRYLPESGMSLVQAEADLWSRGDQPEPDLVQELAESLAQDLHPGDQVAAPLAVGDHRDHHLVRQAALWLRRPLWFYPDVPYALRNSHPAAFYGSAGRIFPAEITAPALAAWQAAVADYASQLSTFWPDKIAMQEALADYARQGGGRLLQPDHREG